MARKNNFIFNVAEKLSFQFCYVSLKSTWHLNTQGINFEHA